MDGLETAEYLKKLHEYMLLEIRHVYNAYLSSHLNSGELSLDEEKWQRDKKSLIIFSHAAFENYIEMLSIALIDYAYHEFKFNKKNTDILLYFFWSRKDHKPKFTETEWDCNNRELILNDIDELTDTFKNDIMNSNHGIKTKNLNNLLRSVGLDLTAKEELKSSLSKLTDLRGEFAHRFLKKGKQLLKINNIEGPEEISRLVINSYRLSYRLYLRALVLVEHDSVLEIVDDERKKMEALIAELSEPSLGSTGDLFAPTTS